MQADRPFMPGYGVLPETEGSGLIPWAEAERRLTATHDFWCATVTPDGTPHVMPVWGVWLEDEVWFSSGLQSRKARNLAADRRCTLTTDDAQNPVVVEGTARTVVDRPALERFVAAMNAKYASGMTLEFLDPTVNGSYAVRPGRAFALTHDDFTGSPTRWRFSRSE
jgi:PPOX class probable F420-dependent enzyme